jgi:hypothetical protein
MTAQKSNMKGLTKFNLSRGSMKGLRTGLCSVKDKSGKSLVGMGIWKKQRGAFTKYLDSLTSASPFRSEKGFLFLQSLGAVNKAKVIKRLKLVDPEGLRLVRKSRCKYRHAKKIERKRKLDKLQTVAVEQNLVALAQEAFEAEGIVRFRFVPADGIMATVAYLLAVGHSRLEVSEKLHLDPSIIKAVTSEMVAQQKKNIGMETIIKAANQKVAFDLSMNAVDKSTATADRIATSRMKLVLDAHKPGAKRGLLPSEIRDKAQSHEDRFGAAKSVEEEKEEEEET